MEDRVLAGDARDHHADTAAGDDCFPDGASVVKTWRLLYKSFENDRCSRFLIDKDFNLVLANGRARRLLKSQEILSGGRTLHFRFPAAEASLEAIVATARGHGHHWHHKVAPIREGRWASLYARCLDPDSGHVEVLVRPLEPPQTESSMAPVMEAFALTAMEARVLLGLVLSLSPKVIASRNRISVHTVRAHIRNIYAKLGTRGNSATLSLALQLLS